MPDTKVAKTANGWIDKDDPNTYYRVRRLARDARRAKRINQGQPKGVTVKAQTAQQIGLVPKVTKFSVFGMKNSVTGVPQGSQQLTSLQDKLYTRLTTSQGVDPTDALSIITSNGYNKAASYGHMRAAGATHAEAEIVINLDNPDISLAYGKAREAGESHTNALSSALNVNN